MPHPLLKRLSSYIPKTDQQTAISSAVLILLLCENEEPQEIVLIKRPQNISTYAGDVCFPGGLKEECDSNLLATALRETKEEIGVQVPPQSIIGCCDDFYDVRQQLVRPYIAVMDKQLLTLDKSNESATFSDEVEKIYFLPINKLLQLKIHTKKKKPTLRKPT